MANVKTERTVSGTGYASDKVTSRTIATPKTQAKPYVSQAARNYKGWMDKRGK